MCSFECPVSLEELTDPVVAQDGQVYNKSAICTWFHRSKESPITREVIPSKIMRSSFVSSVVDERHAEVNGRNEVNHELNKLEKQIERLQAVAMSVEVAQSVAEHLTVPTELSISCDGSEIKLKVAACYYLIENHRVDMQSQVTDCILYDVSGISFKGTQIPHDLRSMQGWAVDAMALVCSLRILNMGELKSRVLRVARELSKNADYNMRFCEERIALLELCKRTTTNLHDSCDLLQNVNDVCSASKVLSMAIIAPVQLKPLRLCGILQSPPMETFSKV